MERWERFSSGVLIHRAADRVAHNHCSQMQQRPVHYKSHSLRRTAFIDALFVSTGRPRQSQNQKNRHPILGPAFAFHPLYNSYRLFNNKKSLIVYASALPARS